MVVSSETVETVEIVDIAVDRMEAMEGGGSCIGAVVVLDDALAAWVDGLDWVGWD